MSATEEARNPEPESEPKPEPEPEPGPEEEFPDEEYPESWLPWKTPEQPRTLVGQVTEYSLGPDFGYGRQWVCTVTGRDQKAWSVWVGRPPDTPGGRSGMLWRQFEEHRPMPGETVTLRYIGFQDKPKGGGPGYHRIRLTVDRGPQLPEFLTRPQLDAGEIGPDVPIDTAGLPDVPDADVVEEGDDEPLPF
jgi:hypothetical protein